MNKFNTFIEKRNFKKIFIVYIIAAVICGAACAGAVGYAYRDKISLALQYEKTSEMLKKQGTDEKKKQSLDSLAKTSGDICDVLLLDEKNNVIYSAKNSDFAADGVFELKKTDGSRFLENSKSTGAVFRFVKKEEFMLSSVFADDFKEIRDEYDEDNFYLENFRNKKLYLISLLGKKDSSEKAYVISDPKPVQFGMLSLKISASVVMLLFMLYIIIVALWVYQNARRSGLSAPVWGIVTLFTNLAGVLVYLIYKHVNGTCGFCGAVQPRENIYCTECGRKMGNTCDACGHFIKPADRYCPRCGHKQK